MSEAELFTMRARLQGGLRHKAARGELATKLPIGLVYAPPGQVILDPDQYVQETLRLFFQTFRQVGSSIGVVKYFNRQGLKFPTRPIQGPHCGEVWWTELSSGLALRILHNPRYAGAFAYGRTRLLQSPSGGASYRKRHRPDWHAFVKGAHAGYISWSEFEANQERLQRNLSHHPICIKLSCLTHNHGFRPRARPPYNTRILQSTGDSFGAFFFVCRATWGGLARGR